MTFHLRRCGGGHTSRFLPVTAGTAIETCAEEEERPLSLDARALGARLPR